jgi:hypothetical protein
MSISDFEQDVLDSLSEAQVAAAFLQRLAFVDATADKPERISQLLQLLGDAVSIVSPDSEARRLDRNQLGVQLRGMARRLADPARAVQRTGTDLTRLRQTAADVAFEAYDFGDFVVGETSGWEHATNSDYWSRPVFIESDDGGASRKGSFVVQFAPEQHTVLDTSASVDGVLIGPRATDDVGSVIDGVAETIFKQLGGRRFSVTTGATDFTGSPVALSFRLPGGCPKGINGVRIAYDQDLYAIEFWRLAERFDDRVLVQKSEDIGADDLCRIFTEATGLETDLGDTPSIAAHEDGGPLP